MSSMLVEANTPMAFFMKEKEEKKILSELICLIKEITHLLSATVPEWEKRLDVENFLVA